MSNIDDWIRETVSGTPGTGTITLGGALPSYIQFEDAFTTGDLVHYSVIDGNDREYGIGTLTTGSPWTLARTTPIKTFDAGVYDGTTPAAISLTSEAVVSVTAMAYQPGSLVGSNLTTHSTYHTFNVAIPLDNTIPQSSEGTELMTVAYTPLFSNSRLLVTAQVISRNDITDSVIVAMFKDSATDAVTAVSSQGSDITLWANKLTYEEVITSTTAVTFKIRVGTQDTSDCKINGGSTANLYGGIENTYILVEEYRV